MIISEIHWIAFETDDEKSHMHLHIFKKFKNNKAKLYTRHALKLNWFWWIKLKLQLIVMMKTLRLYFNYILSSHELSSCNNTSSGPAMAEDDPVKKNITTVLVAIWRSCKKAKGIPWRIICVLYPVGGHVLSAFVSCRATFSSWSVSSSSWY